MFKFSCFFQLISKCSGENNNWEVIFFNSCWMAGVVDGIKVEMGDERWKQSNLTPTTRRRTRGRSVQSNACQYCDKAFSLKIHSLVGGWAISYIACIICQAAPGRPQKWPFLGVLVNGWICKDLLVNYKVHSKIPFARTKLQWPNMTWNLAQHCIMISCLIVLECKYEDYDQTTDSQQSWSTRATKLEGIVSVSHWQGMQMQMELLLVLLNASQLWWILESHEEYASTQSWRTAKRWWQDWPIDSDSNSSVQNMPFNCVAW